MTINRTFTTIALVALVSGAVGAVWSERVALVRWAALRAIDRLELGPASLVVDAVSLGSVRASRLSLRGGALRIDTVDAAFNPLALVAEHIERVDIIGLDVALTLGPGGLAFGGKPLGGAGSGAAPGWRIDEAVFANAKIAIATSTGDVRTTLSAHLALGSGVVSARDLAADATVPIGGAPRVLHLAAGGLTAAPHTTGLPLLSLTKASITAEGLAWRASGVDITLTSSADRLAVVTSIAALASLQQPPIIATLRLSGGAHLADGTAEATFTATTAAHSPFSIEATGRYELASASGSMVLTMAPLVFGPRGFQPHDLVPALPPLATNFTGSVGLAGSIAWRDGALAPNLLLRLDNLGFNADAAQIRALTGALRITKLWPPATPPHQALTATIEAPGLPAAQLSLHGQLTAKPALAVEKLVAAIAGGEIAAAPLTIDPAAPALDTALQVSHVDLAELTKLLGIDGLGGTGALDGDIPVAFSNHKLTVRNGKFAAKGPGVLRYQPQNVPPQIAAAGESVELALKVLSDFHYDRLSLELDKSADGEGTVLLHMEGNNPAVMSGRAFNFNIRVESNFDRLADYALLSLRSAQDLLRRAAERNGP
ncbi:MAG TPA: YdbH domain-containing protein [Stellaceae bacterium]|nr:YdbH domain-containing protein [Stellaceae bacterium]